MKNPDILRHAKGESLFTDDIVVPEETLHAAVFSSPVAHGIIKRLNLETARQTDGIYGILTADDIPCANQIGSIIQDEPLLASSEANYIGQPIAIVVGKSAAVSRAAIQEIEFEFEELPAVFDARESCHQGQLIIPPRDYSLGNTEDTWQHCDVIVEGKADSGGQEHLYFETQSTFAYITKSGGLKVISSTQSLTDIQRCIASVLGLPMNQVEVDVSLVGGSFGGKQYQAKTWAALAALAAFRLKKPVKLILSRDEDIRITGKRHPYSTDFKIGLTKEGKILAYEVTYYQNAGAIADLSTALLEKTLLHTTGSYFIPNVTATGISCRTNLPPNTAMRGFGGPESAFVIEAAIFKAAQKMGIDPSVIQRKNLLQVGDPLIYGMNIRHNQACQCWEAAEKKYEINEIRRQIREFNESHQLQKKGLAMMPICYGIAFETIFLNQASALVHVYTDGSVSVSTAAVEMGQGVNMKIRTIAAWVLGIPPDKIKIESTNTARIPNTSTSGNCSTDLNGHATQSACLIILDRLKKFAAQQLDIDQPDDIEIRNGTICLRGKETQMTWEKLVSGAYFQRINLSARAHYTIPDVSFDFNQKKGTPFFYHVFGTAVIEALVDCLRGTYQIETARILQDVGNSSSPLIDKGQVEGGVLQGIGWMTIEELNYADNGSLLSDNLDDYNIPDICFAPDIEVDFLENAENSPGIFSSKALGEPPFFYGIGAYFAILQAMKAFRPTLTEQFSAPLTSEKVLLSLYGN